VSGLRVFAWWCALSRAGGGGGASGPGVLFVTMGRWYFRYFPLLVCMTGLPEWGLMLASMLFALCLVAVWVVGFSFVWGSGSREAVQLVVIALACS